MIFDFAVSQNLVPSLEGRGTIAIEEATNDQSYFG